MNFVLGDICAKECVPVFECVLPHFHWHTHTHHQKHTHSLMGKLVMSIDGLITFSADTAVTLLSPCRNYTPEDLLQAHCKHTELCFSATLDIAKISHWEGKY